MLRTVYSLIFIIMFSPVFGQDEDESPINNTTELKRWCKEKSEAHFVAKDKTPYNWTASWKTKGNMLVVKGKWRVEGEKKQVECRIIKGAKRKFASLDILTP